jgi:response regulator of citrate/malate metabolism
MKKILIAASNKNDIKLLSYYIKKYFVAELIYADNAGSAIKMLRRDPNIIIYDAYMEGGSDFINYCSNAGCEAPIIAMAFLDEAEIMEKLCSLGVMSYLAKPFNSFYLYEKLEELFR